MNVDNFIDKFGQEVAIKLKGAENEHPITGRICQINERSERGYIEVGLEQENGLIDQYDIRQIREMRLIFAGSRQREIVKNISVRVVERMQSFSCSLPEDYREELDSMLEKLTRAKEERTLQLLREALKDEVEENSRDEVYEQIRSAECLDDSGKELLVGIAAYCMYDAKNAFAVFRMAFLKNYCSGSLNVRNIKDMIEVSERFDCEPLSFWLLNLMFSEYLRPAEFTANENYWWRLLYYAMKYTNFETLPKITIQRGNIRAMIDTVVHIFKVYKKESLAEKLVQQFSYGDEDGMYGEREELRDEDEAIRKVEFYMNYLPDTVAGYYVRCEKALRQIVMDIREIWDAGEEFTFEEVDGSRNGFVYEYVNDKSYGSIIGYDLRLYFFHRSDLSRRVEGQILQNLSRKKELEEEQPVQVMFVGIESGREKPRANDVM